jgi:hypothetical protein
MSKEMEQLDSGKDADFQPQQGSAGVTGSP